MKSLKKIASDNIEKFLLMHEHEIAQDGRKGKNWGLCYHAFWNLFERVPRIKS